ncbi:MAG TPA: acetolactate synthase small subunit [Spirochaetia bacterium]|nr:acetolactate synthase small subunit [Spirochaetia bacterium]
MKHVICLHVENKQGVLARIAGLFSGRGYNLESITAGATADPTVTRITLACLGDDTVVEQIKKQLNRLIDVIRVTDLTGLPALHRELLLIKVSARPSLRGEIFQVADVFKAQVMDVGHDTMSLELTGATDKIDDFIALLSPYGLVEMARSGLVSLERSKKTPASGGEPRVRGGLHPARRRAGRSES